MKKMVTVILLMMCIAALAWSGNPEEGYDLVYRYKVDKPLKYKMKISQLEEKKFSGYAAIPTQINTYMQFAQENKTEEGDSLLSVLMTIEQSEVITRMAGRTFEPSTAVLNAKNITARVTPKGTVKEAVGLEFLPRVQTNPSDMAGVNLGEYLNEFFLELPEQEINVGDKWKVTQADTTDQNGLTTIQIVIAEFNFKKIAKKNGYECAQITAKLTIDLTQSGPAMGGEVSFDGDGKGKLDAFFAIEEGILVLYKHTTSIDGLVKVTGAQELDGTISIETESEYQLSK